MITVTAPTGTIGAQVVDRLLEQGAPVRVVVRDPARLSHRVRAAVDVIEGTSSKGRTPIPT
ncbi:NAD(P)H-binding protein [Mycolicibacterium tokaiense]|uniref:NAD(P)H-binding protein n=1 Tax=Mycolicibacterium tokaiense TaxID=39695 RepID=UPI0018D7B2E2|nr:NAD(P)H-binding protein [Mycolicibacterium tokaiense]